MNIQYIHHSCYKVEGERAIVVFDYWQDPQNLLHQQLEESSKQVYFVVSHFHEDHYNAEILEWEGAKVIISYDTKKRRRVMPAQCAAVMHFDDVYEDENLRLTACRSTDVGLSYVLEMDGETAFHAGDLNNWYFEEGNENLKITAHEMEGLFYSIVREIIKKYPEIDHVMFPIDPRLGTHTLRGICQWMLQIRTKVLYPMHTWEQDINPYLDQLRGSFPDLKIVW